MKLQRLSDYIAQGGDYLKEGKLLYRIVADDVRELQLVLLEVGMVRVKTEGGTELTYKSNELWIEL